MLQPAPMAVAIFGQLTLVAAAADFKLVHPSGGFRLVKYPDSFRASIVQLVNTGVIALNKSYANFDEINKRCSGVKPGVNNIISLLVGDEDSTPEENNAAIQRYLPNQIKQLSGTIDACLAKAKETDTVFHDLLELTMEIHESCSATQGDNEAKIKDAELRKTLLGELRHAAEENKKLCSEDVKRAREDFDAARTQFNEAADSMPSGWELAGLQLVDGITRAFTDPLGIKKIFSGSHTSHSLQNLAVNAAAGNPSPVQPKAASDASDPGYGQAAVIRQQALLLQALLSSGRDGGIDWKKAALEDKSGCRYISQSLTLVVERLNQGPKSNTDASEVTTQVRKLAKRGIELSRKFADAAPTQNSDVVKKLKEDIPNWVVQVLQFASEADLKLNTNAVGNSPFITPDQNPPSGGAATEMAVKSAQYRLSIAEAQLNASREGQRKTTDKMMETTAALGEIMGQIAGLDVQRIEWDKIRQILIRAIGFLCQLKACLDDLVHFFTTVNNIVSVSLNESASQFIRMIQDATAPGAIVKSIGGVTIDRWARQVIYSQAISAAKVARLVENIADLYVELYNGNIHPGVNKLLKMGALIGSGDQAQIAAAGADIQIWAEGASSKIRGLVNERLRQFEGDIQKRVKQLENSLGGILPPNNNIKRIVAEAQEDRIKEVTDEIDATAAAKPTYKKSRSKNVFL